MAAIVPSTGGGFTTATDSSEIDFTISGRDITANLIDGSIGATRLDSAVNTSLSLANSSVQPGTLSNYETTTQLNARDTANRNRANHTGTQLAATISDIGTTISANTDVAANTAARHAAVTVTDSSEIDFTLTGQNITANLIDGSIGATRLSAGVNTSLGLANSALQPSTIGVTVQGYSAVLAGISQGNDGQIINGVAHFVRNTTPTVRVGGSALVVGDRWYNSSTGDQWFWNGTYWLSSNRLSASHHQVNINATTNSLTIVSYAGETLPPGNLFIEQITINQLSPWTFGTGVTSFNLNIGLARPQQFMGSGWILLSRDVFANPLVTLNAFSINTFLTGGSTRRIQIEYQQSGFTGGVVTNSSYFDVSLLYRLAA